MSKVYLKTRTEIIFNLILIIKNKFRIVEILFRLVQNKSSLNNKPKFTFSSTTNRWQHQNKI